MRESIKMSEILYIPQPREGLLVSSEPCDMSCFWHEAFTALHVALIMSPFKLKIDNCVTADVSRLSGIMKTFIRKSTPVFKKKREWERETVCNQYD